MSFWEWFGVAFLAVGALDGLLLLLVSLGAFRRSRQAKRDLQALDAEFEEMNRGDRS